MNIIINNLIQSMTHLHKITCPESKLYLPDVGLEISLLYFARHSEEFIQIENDSSVQLVTLVIIQFIKDNTLMVLECLLETENGVNLDRLTWCTSIGLS